MSYQLSHTIKLFIHINIRNGFKKKRKKYLKNQKKKARSFCTRKFTSNNLKKNISYTEPTINTIKYLKKNENKWRYRQKYP